MKTLTRMLIGLSVSALAACSTEESPRKAPLEEKARRGVSEAELSTLLAPEPGAVAEDYEEVISRYRLFGVQLSQTPSESFATLADTQSWETRNIRVGERLGRNLRVTAMTEEGLTLAGPGGTQVLAVGQDVPLRILYHRFDRAVVHQGKHHWKVDGGAVAQIRGRYGLGAQARRVDVFSQPAILLNHIQEDGVLGRLGLRNGTLLLSMDGTPLTPDDLGALADRLSTPGGSVRLKVFRESGFQELTFSVEGT